ncbi:MAG: hypothetical protein ABSF29_14385 [Tepidisphaeraceae bacterium]|jgi:hypothetical protein
MDDSLPPDSTPPKRHRPVIVDYYARRAAEEVHRFQEGFTRENIISFLKTLVWVIPLTLLIWVYAEQEQQITQTNISASITVKSTDPSRTVTLSADEKVILLDLYGPRSSIDRVQDFLATTAPLNIDIDQSLPLGEHDDIQTLPRIENDPRFKNLGITVVKASPEYLKVFVDRLETIEIPVEAPPGLLTVQNAIFTPPTVKITGPSQALDHMKQENGHLSAVADIANLPILNAPGQHPPIAVSLIPPDSSDGVTLSTQTVQATLTVKESDVIGTVTNLSISLLGPETVLDKYNFSFDPPIYPAVKLIGPPDKIAQLVNEQGRKPIAALEILSDDDAKDSGPKKLSILDLPDGVRVAPGEDTEVSVTVTAR